MDILREIAQVAIPLSVALACICAAMIFLGIPSYTVSEEWLLPIALWSSTGGALICIATAALWALLGHEFGFAAGPPLLDGSLAARLTVALGSAAGIGVCMLAYRRQPFAGYKWLIGVYAVALITISAAQSLQWLPQLAPAPLINA